MADRLLNSTFRISLDEDGSGFRIFPDDPKVSESLREMMLRRQNEVLMAASTELEAGVHFTWLNAVGLPAESLES